MDPFLRRVAKTGALLLGLVVVEQLHPDHRLRSVPAPVGALVRDLSRHGPNEEDEQGLLAGYYEDLLDASNATTKQGGLLTRRAGVEEGWQNSIKLDETHERVPSFIWYRLKSDLDVATQGGPRVITNRFGMPDRDCTLEKPAGTWRVAFVGDSLVRGLGAPFGRALEPRFEEWLNATQKGDRATRPPAAGAARIESYEVLNFGVEGYRLTQLLDVAVERAPPFQPDAVLIGITDIGASRNFGNHLARLVHEGVDLKYPFLREVVAKAGVRASDAIDEAEAKLVRFRKEILSYCLREIRDRSRQGGAATVAVLIPTVVEPFTLESRFAEMRAILEEFAIPTLDLLATFDGIEDLTPLRVSRVDHHPTDAGYGMLLAKLEEQLAQKPEAAELLLGHPLR